MQEPARYFSLNKLADWNKGLGYNLHATDDGIAINRTEKYGPTRIVRGSDLEGAAELADFAVGRGGKLHVLDENGVVWTYDADNKHNEPLFRSGHGLFTKHAKLAAEDDTLYVADGLSEQRLMAFSAASGQPLWSASAWEDSELYPLAIAADGRKHVYTVVPIDMMIGMSGKAEVPGGGRIGVLEWNAAGRVVRVYEHDLLRLADKTKVAHLLRRYFVAAGSNREVTVFDSERRLVATFAPDGTLRSSFSLAQGDAYAGLSIDSAHHLFIGDSRRQLSGDEDERFIVRFDSDGGGAKIAGYRGRADKLVQGKRDRLYVFDAIAGELTQLDLQQRTLELAPGALPEAVYFSGALDSTEAETIWHKVTFDAEIPDETQIRISFFASDRKELFIDGEYLDISGYMTDASIPAQTKLLATRPLWSDPIVNPRDALLVKAQGRYLWFKLELVGSEFKTPFVRKLRVYFPRVSLLSYLPPVYQEDTGGSDFLERFLAMFGTFVFDMEETIGSFGRNLDADAVSGPYLRWLGNWLAAAETDAWEEEKVRALILAAPELYKQRGTRAGLERMLELFTGEKPLIVEYFQYKEMQGKTELRELFTRLYGDNPYCFSVMLKPDSVRTDKMRFLVQQIIDDQKPAYTEAKLIVLQPWMYADMHTYLGINTYLSEPTLMTLEGRASMPYNTVLIDIDQDRRMDVHTRLGLDSELDN